MQKSIQNQETSFDKKFNASQFVLEPYPDFALLLLPNLNFGQGHAFKTELIINPSEYTFIIEVLIHH